jgi:hypothetical protein
MTFFTDSINSSHLTQLLIPLRHQLQPQHSAQAVPLVWDSPLSTFSSFMSIRSLGLNMNGISHMSTWCWCSLLGFLTVILTSYSSNDPIYFSLFSNWFLSSLCRPLTMCCSFITSTLFPRTVSETLQCIQ